MEAERRINLSVGFLMILGMVCIAYLSVSFGNIDLFRREGYFVRAEFSNVTGLKVNTAVEMLGIRIGRVKKIALREFKAEVVLLIDRGVDMPEDSIAAVRTRGLLGEQYVSISPGGLETTIAKDGTGEIRETQPPLIMEEMIGKMMFGTAEKKEK